MTRTTMIIQDGIFIYQHRDVSQTPREGHGDEPSLHRKSRARRL